LSASSAAPPVDLDRTFEVRAVFDHDLGRRQISDHRTVLFDFSIRPFARTFPLHIAVHHHVAGVDVRRYFRRRSDRQPPAVELDQSFDQAVDEQILGAGDIAFSHAGSIPATPYRGPRPQSNGLIASRRFIASLGLIASVLFLLHMESSYGQHTQFPDGVRQLDRPLRLAEIPASFQRPALRPFLQLVRLVSSVQPRVPSFKPRRASGGPQ